jgi:hypothetical protein
MEDWPVDLDGFPYSTGELPCRLTHCCGAATSIDDGPLYCKSCYAEVPLDYATPPRPGNGPVRLDLQRAANDPGTKRLAVLVIERFGNAQASVHDSPEQALAVLHDLVVKDWNIDRPVPKDPAEAVHQYFAGLGHYADYAVVPVELGTA